MDDAYSEVDFLIGSRERHLLFSPYCWYVIVVMLTMCVLHVGLGSSVTPNLLGRVFMGSVVLCILCISSLV